MPTQIKAIKQYFNVVLFVILCKIVLTFEPVVEILNCNYFNESYQSLLPMIILYKFRVCG